MGIDTKSRAHNRRQIGPPVEWGEVISGGAWQVAHKYQGFEVFVTLRDVGYVVLSRFPLVHRMGVQVRFVVLTGGLEGLSESTFETVVTQWSEAEALWCVGRTALDRFAMMVFPFRFLTFVAVPHESFCCSMRLEMIS